MVTDTNYRIKIKKGDYEIELQGDKEWVEKKFEEIMKKELFLQPSLPSPQPTVTPPSIDLPMSLVEFLISKGNPTRHTDKAILFSYWLSKKENIEIFNINDIEICYDQARVTKPRNISHVMNSNQRKGFLVESIEKKDNMKSWKITLTGEKYVEDM